MSIVGTAAITKFWAKVKSKVLSVAGRYLPLSGGTVAGDILLVASDRRKLVVKSDGTAAFTAFIDLHDTSKAYDSSGEVIAAVEMMIDSDMSGMNYRLYFKADGSTICYVEGNDSGITDLDIGAYALTNASVGGSFLSGTLTLEIMQAEGGIDPNASPALTLSTDGTINAAAVNVDCEYKVFGVTCRLLFDFATPAAAEANTTIPRPFYCYCASDNGFYRVY